MFLARTSGRIRSGGTGPIHGYSVLAPCPWFVGILLGFVKLRDNPRRMGSLEASPGYLVEEPYIRVFVTAILALLLSMFALLVLVGGYSFFFVGSFLCLSSGIDLSF
jgi:hypothetical protein